MREKQCRLTLASKCFGGMMGGGGGGVEIPQRAWSQEWPQIKQGYKGQENQYLRFTNRDPLLRGAYAGVEANLLPILQSGGALTTEGMRQADQAALGLAANAGMGNTKTGVAQALLNREALKQERFGTALAQTLGTEKTGVSSFSQLTNPILSYLSDLFSSNQNAAAAESIAGANQSAGKGSGIMSTIGSVAGAVGAAY